jgi:hypothetical protein
MEEHVFNIVLIYLNCYQCGHFPYTWHRHMEGEEGKMAHKGGFTVYGVLAIIIV